MRASVASDQRIGLCSERAVLQDNTEAKPWSCISDKAEEKKKLRAKHGKMSDRNKRK